MNGLTKGSFFVQSLLTAEDTMLASLAYSGDNLLLYNGWKCFLTSNSIWTDCVGSVQYKKQLYYYKNVNIYFHIHVFSLLAYDLFCGTTFHGLYVDHLHSFYNTDFLQYRDRLVRMLGLYCKSPFNRNVFIFVYYFCVSIRICAGCILTFRYVLALSIQKVLNSQRT